MRIDGWQIEGFGIFRDWEVRDDYANLLHRTQPPSATELNTAVSSGLDILALDIIFAGSQEFQTNG